MPMHSSANAIQSKFAITTSFDCMNNLHIKTQHKIMNTN